MITADELQSYVSLTRHSLVKVLDDSGYSGISFKSVKFLGLTTGGEFCYSVTFFDESNESEVTDKVFVKKATNGNMVAEY